MRFLAGVGMLLAGIFLPSFILVPLAAIYALRWWAVELLFMGAAIDAYFGVVDSFPYYTSAAAFIVLTAEYAKKHLSIFKGG